MSVCVCQLGELGYAPFHGLESDVNRFWVAMAITIQQLLCNFETFLLLTIYMYIYAQGQGCVCVLFILGVGIVLTSHSECSYKKIGKNHGNHGRDSVYLYGFGLTFTLEFSVR